MNHPIFYHLFLASILLSTLLLQNYASADSSPVWYRYTVQEQEQNNGTLSGTYFHIIMLYTSADESSGSEKSYPVSGKPVPWSDTVPQNLVDNHTEYCTMSTAIKEYFQNLDITPQDIRLWQFTDVGDDYGSSTNTKYETDFFIVLESSKYNSTMMNSGFYMADSRYEYESQSILDCNSTSQIQNNTGDVNVAHTSTVPEFPLASIILVSGITSVIIMYKIKK